MDDPIRRLRHDIRGRLNAVKLCGAALETPLQPAESVEFLDDIIGLCDSLAELMDQWDGQELPELHHP